MFGSSKSKKSDNTLYAHAPIVADREIRLFRFSKNCKSKSIHISIETVRLNKLPTFECLSYSWGDPGNTRPIRCGSRVLNITTNLYDALQRIRVSVDPERSKRRFWADQISIDQRNAQEKDIQVPHMSIIFPSARRVICWLGEENGMTARSFEMLRSWERAEGDKRLWLQLSQEMIHAVNTGSHVTDPGFQALNAFFAHDWFERMWMLQEVYVSHKKPPIVVCGSHSISWNALCAAFHTMTSTVPGIGPATVLGDRVRYVLPMFEIYMARGTNSIRMSTLLDQASHRAVSDKRDRVYALLGIARQEGFNYPRPNYGQESEGAMFTRYTRNIIEQERSLDILSMRRRSETPANQPSWVFDPTNVYDLRSMLMDHRRRKAFRGGGASGRVSSSPVTARRTSLPVPSRR
jgi:hypothetical protein